MGTRSLRLLLAAALCGGVLVTGPAASACSFAMPPDIAGIYPGVPAVEGDTAAVVGVYEFEYIARSPRLLISGPRAVTVVTRYWGHPPAHLGLEMTGDDAGLFGYSSCGDLTRPTGTRSYWYSDERSVDREDWGRSWLTLVGTEGSLSEAQEAMLDERFGPPVVLGVTLADRGTALVALWKWHMLAALLIGAAVVVVVRRRRRSIPTPAP